MPFWSASVRAATISERAGRRASGLSCCPSEASADRAGGVHLVRERIAPLTLHLLKHSLDPGPAAVCADRLAESKDRDGPSAVAEIKRRVRVAPPGDALFQMRHPTPESNHFAL